MTPMQRELEARRHNLPLPLHQLYCRDCERAFESEYSLATLCPDCIAHYARDAEDARREEEGDDAAK